MLVGRERRGHDHSHAIGHAGVLGKVNAQVFVAEGGVRKWMLALDVVEPLRVGFGRSMRPQRLAVAEQKIEGPVRCDVARQLAQRDAQFAYARHVRMRLGQLLHDPAKGALAVGTAYRFEAAMQARCKISQIAVVGKHPVAAPQLTHKRMTIFQRHTALRGLADVRYDVAAFDRVAADQLGHR